MEDRIEFNPGDILVLNPSRYKTLSTLMKDITETTKVRTIDAGFSGGWDVYGGCRTDNNKLVNFYGFQVISKEKVHES